MYIGPWQEFKLARVIANSRLAEAGAQVVYGGSNGSTTGIAPNSLPASNDTKIYETPNTRSSASSAGKKSHSFPNESSQSLESSQKRDFLSASNGSGGSQHGGSQRGGSDSGSVRGRNSLPGTKPQRKFETNLSNKDFLSELKQRKADLSTQKLEAYYQYWEKNRLVDSSLMERKRKSSDVSVRVKSDSGSIIDVGSLGTSPASSVPARGNGAVPASLERGANGVASDGKIDIRKRMGAHRNMKKNDRKLRIEQMKRMYGLLKERDEDMDLEGDVDGDQEAKDDSNQVFANKDMTVNFMSLVDETLIPPPLEKPFSNAKIQKTSPKIPSPKGQTNVYPSKQGASPYGNWSPNRRNAFMPKRGEISPKKFEASPKRAEAPPKRGETSPKRADKSFCLENASLQKRESNSHSVAISETERRESNSHSEADQEGTEHGASSSADQLFSHSRYPMQSLTSTRRIRESPSKLGCTGKLGSPMKLAGGSSTSSTTKLPPLQQEPAAGSFPTGSGTLSSGLADPNIEGILSSIAHPAMVESHAWMRNHQRGEGSNQQSNGQHTRTHPEPGFSDMVKFEKNDVGLGACSGNSREDHNAHASRRNPDSAWNAALDSIQHQGTWNEKEGRLNDMSREEAECILHANPFNSFAHSFPFEYQIIGVQKIIPSARESGPKSHLARGSMPPFSSAMSSPCQKGLDHTRSKAPRELIEDDDIYDATSSPKRSPKRHSASISGSSIRSPKNPKKRKAAFGRTLAEPEAQFRTSVLNNPGNQAKVSNVQEGQEGDEEMKEKPKELAYPDLIHGTSPLDNQGKAAMTVSIRRRGEAILSHAESSSPLGSHFHNDGQLAYYIPMLPDIKPDTGNQELCNSEATNSGTEETDSKTLDNTVVSLERTLGNTMGSLDGTLKNVGSIETANPSRGHLVDNPTKGPGVNGPLVVVSAGIQGILSTVDTRGVLEKFPAKDVDWYEEQERGLEEPHVEESYGEEDRELHRGLKGNSLQGSLGEGRQLIQEDHVDRRYLIEDAFHDGESNFSGAGARRDLSDAISEMSKVDADFSKNGTSEGVVTSEEAHHQDNQSETSKKSSKSTSTLPTLSRMGHKTSTAKKDVHNTNNSTQNGTNTSTKNDTKGGATGYGIVRSGPVFKSEGSIPSFQAKWYTVNRDEAKMGIAGQNIQVFNTNCSRQVKCLKLVNHGGRSESFTQAGNHENNQRGLHEYHEKQIRHNDGVQLVLSANAELSATRADSDVESSTARHKRLEHNMGVCGSAASQDVSGPLGDATRKSPQKPSAHDSPQKTSGTMQSSGLDRNTTSRNKAAVRITPSRNQFANNVHARRANVSPRPKVWEKNGWRSLSPPGKKPAGFCSHPNKMVENRGSEKNVEQLEKSMYFGFGKDDDGSKEDFVEQSAFCDKPYDSVDKSHVSVDDAHFPKSPDRYNLPEARNIGQSPLLGVSQDDFLINWAQNLNPDDIG